MQQQALSLPPPIVRLNSPSHVSNDGTHHNAAPTTVPSYAPSLVLSPIPSFATPASPSSPPSVIPTPTPSCVPDFQAKCKTQYGAHIHPELRSMSLPHCRLISLPLIPHANHSETISAATYSAIFAALFPSHNSVTLESIPTANSSANLPVFYIPTLLSTTSSAIYSPAFPAFSSTHVPTYSVSVPKPTSNPTMQPSSYVRPFSSPITNSSPIIPCTQPSAIPSLRPPSLTLATLHHKLTPSDP